jgi:FSR family fosmidomycin resistance protein-like MFS transporter
VEFVDELVFGAWTAAWPLIRSDLGLSYQDIGLLLALPGIFASLVEPPLGLLGDAWDRRVLVRGGGLAFVAGLLLVVASGGFGTLLLALLLVFPASGAFVSLSQATLMDLDPRRHELHMARWVLAGSLGVVAGPLALSAAGMVGWGWRETFALTAAVGTVALLLVWRAPGSAHPTSAEPIASAVIQAAREAGRALRRRSVLRWLALIHVADLMLDVLLGFLALYYVDVVGTSNEWAAGAVLAFTTVGLLGDATVIPVLKRMDGVRFVRLTGAAVLVLFPSFLIVPGPAAKLVLLAAIALLTSGWYAVVKARLYAAMPGRSATVMALDSLSGLVGGLLPLAIGLVAEHWGLETAMWLLTLGPATLLLALPRDDLPSAPYPRAMASTDEPGGDASPRRSRSSARLSP